MQIVFAHYGPLQLAVVKVRTPVHLLVCSVWMYNIMHVCTELFELVFHTDKSAPATGMCKILYIDDVILDTAFQSDDLLFGQNNVIDKHNFT